MDIATAGAPGDRVLLMGNEAIARGALEAGLRLAAAYPGTPSSEVVEALAAAAAAHGGLHVEWSTNEKVAFDVAAGAAITGARALVAMKNAGLNWAMDTFMTLPYSGVRGGMLVVVADDPDTHYSSAEQDTRTAAIYAEIPCFEPHDQQAAHDMALAAFSLSEHLELPIMLRSVTRVSHASGDVTLGELPAGPIGPAIGFNRHWRAPYRWNVYGPPGATHKHAWLHSRQPLMQEYAETCPFNVFTSPRGAETAVITSGVAAAYLREAAEDLGLGDQLAVAHLGLIWPLPRHTLAGFLKGIKTVLVVEEGDPVMEEKLAVLVRDLGLDLTIRGKMHAPLFKPYGELNPDLVREALLTATAGRHLPGATTAPSAVGGAGVKGSGADEDSRAVVVGQVGQLVAPRSSTLCAGCPHLGTYWALKQAVYRQPGTPIINGDIGCYEQGGYGLFSRQVEPSDAPSQRLKVTSPYEMLDTIYVMGSGVGMAQGQSHVGHEGPVVAVAGDSTFFHATLPAVVNAVTNHARVTFVVMDNSWTCMTGHQVSPTTGTDTIGQPTTTLDIAGVCHALGVPFVRVTDAYDVKGTTAAFKEALTQPGVAVVVAKRECALQVQRRERRRGEAKSTVNENCNGCRVCLQIGCPAITWDAERKRAGVDRLLCVDCTICHQICPRSAMGIPPAGDTSLCL